MTKKVIVFSVDQQDYCLDIKHVESITEYKQPTPIPSSKSYVEGLINIRGDIYTVLDTANILGRELRENQASRIILLDDSAHMSLHVDNTSNVLNIEEHHIKPHVTLTDNIERQLIKNVINYNDQIIFELDVNFIV